ncbi:hypothetical protein VP01_912g5 [Puccinia sorghi]|uniref:Uncharacterized protein n=1 Tax=Puccinia sorghi TaxID=27349 RepID=A0A0L6U7I7_9BASI|nr:hypothetical protein VP01_912g5 [Puccinia sorghi]
MEKVPGMLSFAAEHAGNERISEVGSVLLRDRYNDQEAEDFLRDSRARFLDLGRKIDESVAKGKLIYLEDGEGDDNWQSLLGALDGIAPELIMTRGGYYKIRLELTRLNWQRFYAVAGQDHPPLIMPIHGSTDGYGTFDTSEGRTDFTPEQLDELREQSKNEAQLAAEIEETKQEVIKRLAKNEFTTIVTKTSASGLAEMISKAGARDKVAIIWTGFMRYEPKDHTFQTKFNFLKNVEASKALLASGVPIVISTPRLNNAEFGAIVASNAALIYSRLSPDVADDFKGFERLEELASPPEGTFAHRLVGQWDAFRVIQEAKLSNYQARFAQLLRQEEKGQPVNQAEKKKLEKYFKFNLPTKWNKIEAAMRAQTDHTKASQAPFRDLCPIDLYAHPIIKGSIRDHSVVEVVAADIKLATKDLYDVTPSSNSNTFIVTKFHTDLFSRDTQRSINWMANGEPLDRSEIPQH